jgi:hypothetical protein
LQVIKITLTQSNNKEHVDLMKRMPLPEVHGPPAVPADSDNLNNLRGKVTGIPHKEFSPMDWDRPKQGSP